MALSSDRARPTYWALFSFFVKSRLLQGLRILRELGARPRRFLNTTDQGDEVGCSVWEVRSPLWHETNRHEKALERGKVANLRVAVQSMRRLVVPAGEVFSFWRQVGAPRRSRGFARGRELREGCLIPTVGGGLCQLSNALFQAARKAGLDVVERHAHTQAVPGSNAEQGQDATVFWNYVDLRFRASLPWSLRVEMTSSELVVQILVPGQGVVPAAGRWTAF